METYFLKIQGKANVPHRLEIGHNYELRANCSITSETKTDSEDGNFEVTFKVEPVTLDIRKDNGPVIKAKDPRKNSVKVRKSVWKVSEDYQIDEEKFYDFVTNRTIVQLELLAEEFKRLRT